MGCLVSKAECYTYGNHIKHASRQETGGGQGGWMRLLLFRRNEHSEENLVGVGRYILPGVKISSWLIG